MFSHVSSRELFATPFLVARLPEADIAAINAELEPAILAKEKQSSGVKISNSGGWQSDVSILEWGGRPMQQIIDATIELLNQITLYLDKNQYSRANIQWRVHGWANINRNADFHCTQFFGLISAEKFSLLYPAKNSLKKGFLKNPVAFLKAIDGF